MAEIGVAIITHNSRQHLAHCLPPILGSAVSKRILVVNSSSGDGTAELASSMGAEVLVIPRRQFNHGATRNLARKHLGTSIVVMMTPDAYATGPEFLELLIAPLRDGSAAASYARQIAHDDAGFFERFPREFNYPATSELRGASDASTYGSYLFFCSNSCAAWRNDALDEIGGFPTVLTNEDTFAAAQLVARGYKIAYTAEAVVKHSHRYTLVQEFKRYVDTGFARAAYRGTHFMAQGDESRGRQFSRAFLARLSRESPWLLPYALAQLAVKYFGYKIGRTAVHLPDGVVKRLSAQDFYWTSVHYTK
jgi:rhamnosyltransferase